jgi:putative nucleotidyltransferase with HDIG domain
MNISLQSNETPLFAFRTGLSNALKFRDAYTRQHCDRVVGISLAIAEELNLSAHELSILEFASALHDVGKIAIPDAILLNPDILVDDEKEVMRSHAVIGAEIVAAYDHIDAKLVSDIIKHHHEWFDGTGYPNNLSDDNIPLLSRIITIADNYDAMALRRVYQLEKPHSKIMEIMELESGRKLDPGLFDLFKIIIERPENAEYKAS